MKTERQKAAEPSALLREDERDVDDGQSIVTYMRLMRQRLIEEREKNQRLYEKKFHPRIIELEAERDALKAALAIERTWNGRFRDLEAELAEARKDSERLTWMLVHFVDLVDKFQQFKGDFDTRAAIDAAMKEGR